MLEKLLILSLCFVAIRANGEFSILSTPKSLSFKGNDVLRSNDVGEVLSAAMGNPVSGDAQWGGLIINDPFNLPKGIVAVLIEGTNHISMDANIKSYDIDGSSSYESMNAVSEELEASNVKVCDINLDEIDETVTKFEECFGDVAVPTIESKTLEANANNADKQFLQSLGYMHAAASGLLDMKKSSNFLVFRVSLNSVIKEHGEKSEQVMEAQKLLANAIDELNGAAQKSSKNEALVVAIAHKFTERRSKREVVAADAENKYNLAVYYNQDYPVIFNIILWFMVAFGLSLLAICYTIGSMDPGRDSIIYRMTSTRMKKDN